ncbi:helix-turn-helix domain-containing protein [Sphaerisporangium corydalis]|uniref:Helix-turn-helix domain-containing protein n=1 Tax=Sphaerisporangium corydalis TaxID=1441875 RepID=A0ABV9EP39_9ACTN|nr:helix-turn-helix domain-containing protein [Sphaerisporangium corydalis]
MEYVPRVPRPALDGLIDDLYYLEGAPPYARLTLPPMQAAPKRLARTHRFAATVFAIDPAGPIDWGDLASGAGYFDQAHFGHEFRAFTGLTPTRYVEVRRRFMREHPGHVMDGWPLPAD